MTEIRNPAKLPTDLTPAEKEFARCLAEEELCIVGNGELPGPEERIESGEGVNVVRSEVIRFFAFGGNEENPILGSVLPLRGAWISGGLDLTHARIPYALMFSNCHFAASVAMQYARCAAVYLNGSRLTEGLNADGLTTKGNVHLRTGFSAEGEVRLLNANIGGNFDCEGGKFHNPGEHALSADGLTANGSVILRHGFSAEGEVRLLGANIGGILDCENGKFNNANGRAFSADRLTTKGGVNLRHGFSAEGEVRLLGANIGGNLDCESGKFNNANRRAFSADRLMTKGNVHFRNGFSAEGEVWFAGVNIGGSLDCTGGKFNNPNGYALVVEGSNINASLFWRNTTCKGGVNLAYARADMLSDDPNSWKLCKVDLKGFTYNRFSNLMNAQFRIDWLAEHPDRVRFSPLPYEQAATVLFGMGHAHDARKILLEKERLQTKEEEMHWLRKAGRRLWDVFAGYGYRLSYTAMWMAFFIAVGVVVFGVADHHRRIVPTQVIVQANPDYGYAVKSHGARPTDVVPEIFPGYAEFTPLAYSLDVFIPFFILQQESAWLPDSGDSDNVWKPSIILAFAILALAIFAFSVEWIERRCEGPRGRACAYAGVLGVFFAICCYFSNWLFGDWWWLTVWYWLEIIAGWILTSLFLLSVTGLLRPRQSPGERD